MADADQLFIEDVVRVAYGRGAHDAPSFLSHCDLHLTEAGLTTRTRPESKTRIGLGDISIPYAQMREVSAKDIRLSTEEFVKRMSEKLHVKLMAEPGEPRSYHVYILHGKGNHFWNKSTSYFRLRTGQYDVFREFILDKLGALGNATGVRLPPAPLPGDLSDGP